MIRVQRDNAVQAGIWSEVPRVPVCLFLIGRSGSSAGLLALGECVDPPLNSLVFARDDRADDFTASDACDCAV